MATIEIDQSGKWEAPAHTVIGAAMGAKVHSVLITQKTKSTVTRILGAFDQNKNRSKKKLIIRMFTYSVFLAISNMAREEDIIVVDLEYPGNEDSIRDLLLFLFEKFRGIRLSAKALQFRQVGKSSLAHTVAYQTFTYGRSADRQLTFEDYHELFDKTVEIRTKAMLKRKKRNAR